jgi:hypothetical protein
LENRRLAALRFAARLCTKRQRLQTAQIDKKREPGITLVRLQAVDNGDTAGDQDALIVTSPSRFPAQRVNFGRFVRRANPVKFIFQAIVKLIRTSFDIVRAAIMVNVRLKFGAIFYALGHCRVIA